MHCFEPTKIIFEKLKMNVANEENIYFYQIALGSRNDESKIYLASQSVSNSLLNPDDVAGEEVVSISTLDDVVFKNGLKK
ncbi:MAG: FkbM family methyltransferase [Candidatus Omnitrophica bacterium]|nr:FkbM family methyltransferase [Candidatus Omnitrophota bacterium]